jgi:hypothetical protein
LRIFLCPSLAEAGIGGWKQCSFSLALALAREAEIVRPAHYPLERVFQLQHRHHVDLASFAQ